MGLSRRHFLAAGIGATVLPRVSGAAEISSTDIKNHARRFVERIFRLGPGAVMLSAAQGGIDKDITARAVDQNGDFSEYTAVQIHYQRAFERLFQDREILALALRAEKDGQEQYLPALAARIHAVDPGFADRMYSQERLEALINMRLNQAFRKNVFLSNEQRKAVNSNILAGHDKTKIHWQDLDLSLATASSESIINFHWFFLNALVTGELQNFTDIKLPPENPIKQTGMPLTPGQPERKSDLAIRMAGNMVRDQLFRDPYYLDFSYRICGRIETPETAIERRAVLSDYYRTGFQALYEGNESVYDVLRRAETFLQIDSYPASALDELADFLIKNNQRGLSALYNAEAIRQLIVHGAERAGYSAKQCRAIEESLLLQTYAMLPDILVCNLAVAFGMEAKVVERLELRRDIAVSNFAGRALQKQERKKQPDPPSPPSWPGEMIVA